MLLVTGIAQKQTFVTASEAALSEAHFHTKKAQHLHPAEQEGKSAQCTPNLFKNTLRSFASMESSQDL